MNGGTSIQLEKPEDVSCAVYEELVTKQEKAPVSANEVQDIRLNIKNADKSLKNKPTAESRRPWKKTTKY